MVGWVNFKDILDINLCGNLNISSFVELNQIKSNQIKSNQINGLHI